MNPVFRFLYLNMNYHVEHHLLPSVPVPCAARAARRDQGRSSRPPSRTRSPRTGRSSMRSASSSADPTWEIPIDVPTCRRPPGSASTSARPMGQACRRWPRHRGLRLARTGPTAPRRRRRSDVRRCAASTTASSTLADGLCTHAEVHLADGAIVDGQIECPKHNGRFDAATGEPTRKPVRRALVHLRRRRDRWSHRHPSTVRSNSHV